MKDSSTEFNENSPVERAASAWLARRDRGLTAAEQDAYMEWLAADPAHRKAVLEYEQDWEDYDRLAGIHLRGHARIDPDLLSPDNFPERKRATLVRRIAAFAALPLAALVAVAMVLFWRDAEDGSGIKLQPAVELLARIEQRTLEDGSTIEINRGSVVETFYGPAERRVHLRKGEAHFQVAKDSDRPFIVNVAGVDVRAVGTEFSVRLLEDEVDVIVTEGKVNVAPDASRQVEEASDAQAFLEMGQRGRVNLRAESPTVEVTTIDTSEIESVHRWQPRMLDYDKILLGEIVEEFNQSNPIQIVIGDPALERISLSSTFWSDNVEGFVRLMESSFDMEAEWKGSREIVLRKARLCLTEASVDFRVAH